MNLTCQDHQHLWDKIYMVHKTSHRTVEFMNIKAMILLKYMTWTGMQNPWKWYISNLLHYRV